MKTYHYISTSGEKVEVTEDHVRTAIRIKKELQQASPSFRCSWATHKKMMIEEGYDDSESSERYRLFVKSRQSALGELNSREEYQDSVNDSKLESIKNAVGELSYKKREVQLEALKLNRLKRRLVSTGVTSEEIRDSFLNDIDWSAPSYLPVEKIRETSKSEMVVVLSDWHIGATIKNSNGNSFNLKIARDRIEKLLEETIKYAIRFGVTDITVANCGDFIEGLYMRNFNQPYEAELDLSEQISNATKLLIDFLMTLSSHFNVKYFGIAGNHDRWFFDKNTVDSDNAMKIINESVRTAIEISDSNRISYVEVEDNFNYEKIINIGGKVFKFVHGDLEGKNMDISKHESANRQNIDCLVMGHYHHHEVIEGNYGKMNIMNGSLMGRNSYSRKFKAETDASQTLIIVEGETIIPIKVGLQIV